MNYPKLPTAEEQQRLFRNLEAWFLNEFNVVIPEIKTWAEYEGRLLEFKKLEEQEYASDL